MKRSICFLMILLAGFIAASAPAGSLIATAQLFLGIPYSATTLSVTPERLIKRTDSLDCMTFVEMSLAYWQAGSSQYDSVLFAKKTDTALLRMRYYDGLITDYSSRKHYFLAFAIDNPFLEDITPEISNKKVEKTIDYMSTHRELYPLLKDDLLRQKIQEREQTINQKTWFFIPKEDLKNPKITEKFEEADVVGLTVSTQGLDVGHMGFLIKKNKNWHLLHASYTYKKVMITEENLYEYLQKHKKFTGLIVLRLKKKR